MLCRETPNRSVIRQRLGKATTRLAVEICNHRHAETGEVLGMGIVHDMCDQPVELTDLPVFDHLKPPVMAHLRI